LKLITNELITLPLDFTHEEIVSCGKHKTKFLQDLLCLKQLLLTTVYGAISSPTASSVTFAIEHNVLDDGCGHL